LALVEFARLMPAELAGGFGLPGRGVPGSAGIEDHYRRRIDGLPAESRRLVQLAPADPTGDPLLVWRAAERVGIPPHAAVRDVRQRA
jgi:hypothetical protein